MLQLWNIDMDDIFHASGHTEVFHGPGCLFRKCLVDLQALTSLLLGHIEKVFYCVRRAPKKDVSP